MSLLLPNQTWIPARAKPIHRPQAVVKVKCSVCCWAKKRGSSCSEDPDSPGLSEGS